MLALPILALSLPQVQTPACPYPPIPLPPPVAGTYSVCVNATGQMEEYRIEGPSTIIPGQTYPLVVLFHSFGGDHNEMVEPPTMQGAWDGYDFVTRAVDEGYFVMMHDGGHDHLNGHKTYGNEAFQAHTEKAISRVLASFDGIIDPERVFGYGFSMGGGNMASYSARHLDPTSSKGMFAAVVNHSGALSTPSWYYSYQNPQNFLEGIYGTHYPQDPLPYQRASLIDTVCPIQDQGCLGMAQCDLANVNLATSMMLNLWQTPMHTFYNPCDANDNITEPNNLLDQYMSMNPNYWTDTNSGPHRWDSVDSQDVLDFFDGRTLPAVTLGALAGQLLFPDDNKRFLHFKVVRSDPAAHPFGRLIWVINGNRVNLFDPVQVGSVSRVDVMVDQWTPLSTATDLEVFHDLDMKVRVAGYPNFTGTVSKNTGAIQPGDWAYLPNKGMVVLNRSGGNVNTVWTIQP